MAVLMATSSKWLGGEDGLSKRCYWRVDWIVSRRVDRGIVVVSMLRRCIGDTVTILVKKL